jgi:hypothetical protein
MQLQGFSWVLLRRVANGSFAPPEDGTFSGRMSEVWKGCDARDLYFFSVQRLHGFRQVVLHVQLHVSN